MEVIVRIVSTFSPIYGTYPSYLYIYTYGIFVAHFAHLSSTRNPATARGSAELNQDNWQHPKILATRTSWAKLSCKDVSVKNMGGARG